VGIRIIVPEDANGLAAGQLFVSSDAVGFALMTGNGGLVHLTTVFAALNGAVLATYLPRYGAVPAIPFRVFGHAPGIQTPHGTIAPVTVRMAVLSGHHGDWSIYKVLITTVFIT
jgi:hypothetical protein